MRLDSSGEITTHVDVHVPRRTITFVRRRVIVVTRRTALRWLALCGASPWVIGSASKRSSAIAAWFMPAESEPHRRTWMAFAANEKIWGKRYVGEVRRNLAAIAQTIARFEPVTMLVSESDLPAARRMLGNTVEWAICPADDVWVRDTGPVFVRNRAGVLAGVDFNFNGWGQKQEHSRDAQVAAFVTKHSGAKRLRSRLILEGGAIEVDGDGTAILTESCILNPNRNPDLTKEACERELKRLLGLRKIIWLPGVRGRDITDGHTDFYARFARPGYVIAHYDPDPASYDHAVTRRHLEILREVRDAKGRRLDILVLEAPRNAASKFMNRDFAAGYVNFYLCNGAVLVPQFGDARADAAARSLLQDAFPEREVVSLRIDGIAAGGGGIHCVTLQEPRV